mgnify:FL=1
MTYGKLVLSPTRTYAPVAKAVFEKHRSEIHGMIHCSGGAQAKVLNFVEGLTVVKDNMFDVPPLFRAIQSESGTDWEEMYKVFNMGHRLEFYVAPELAGEIVSIAERCGIEARVLGCVEKAPDGISSVIVKSQYGTFTYRK